jgi:hypothetical protein
VSLAGERFEIPARYRHLAKVYRRYARWDLTRVDLVDHRTGAVLCPVRPLDKSANADGQRRRLTPVTADSSPLPPSGIAPLLSQLLADYAATGLPPAYLPPADKVGSINHPQSSLADFYREMGDIFAVPLRPHNRWGGFKALREVWFAHLETTRRRAVLLVDEAQEMSPAGMALT